MIVGTRMYQGTVLPNRSGEKDRHLQLRNAAMARDVRWRPFQTS